MQFRLTPLVIGSLLLTSVLPSTAAPNDPRQQPTPAKCALLAGQIIATGVSCGLGNLAACLALAAATEKFNRECEGGKPPIPPDQGGPTMRPR